MDNTIIKEMVDQAIKNLINRHYAQLYGLDVQDPIKEEWKPKYCEHCGSLLNGDEEW